MAQDQKQGIFVTQEDIDTALAAAPRQEEMSDADGGKPLFLNEADIVDPGLDGDSEGDDFFGLLSKDDIEALLHGDLGGSNRQGAQDEVDALLQTTTAEEAPHALEETSLTDKKNTAQEDVEKLVQGAEALETAGETAEKEEPEVSEEPSAVSQDDIDRLLMEALDEGEDESDTADGETSPENGEVISQGDLDQLLSEAMEDDLQGVEPEASETALAEPKEAPESPDDTEPVAPEAVSESLDEGTGSLISQDDLDQLLEGGGALSDSAPDEPPDDAGKPSEHISQDDINRLLKESLDEVDEDLPSEEPEPEIEDESDFQEPVILAEDETTPEPPPPVEKAKPVENIIKTTLERLLEKRLWENRLIWAAAAGIVILVSVTAMMMSSGPTEPESVSVPESRVLTFTISQTGDGMSPVPLSETSVRFPGFMVLAPPNSADVTYVAADLTLDFSDASTVAVIKENEAFVRDIIYGTISSELMTRDISAIDEISLEQAIRKALGRIVTREAIGRIAFDRFSLV